AFCSTTTSHHAKCIVVRQPSVEEIFGTYVRPVFPMTVSVQVFGDTSRTMPLSHPLGFTYIPNWEQQVLFDDFIKINFGLRSAGSGGASNDKSLPALEEQSQSSSTTTSTASSEQTPDPTGDVITDNEYIFRVLNRAMARDRSVINNTTRGGLTLLHIVSIL